MDQHPPDSDFRRLLRGQLSPAETRAIVVHLLHGCPTCAAQFVLPDLPSGDPDYEALFERLSRPLSRFSRANPPSLLWAELEPLVPSQRRLNLQNRRYRSPAFVSWLTRHSRTIAPQDGASALLAAELAVSVVDQLAHHSELTEDLAHDLRASALAHFGNALRSLGRFAESLDAFHHAERELSSDTDRLTRAEFLSLRASLFRDLGRFDEAARDLRAAYRLGSGFEPHTRGRILLQLAEVVGLDNPAAGVEILTAAADQIDPAREPRLELVLRHRHAWFLNDAGSPGKALEVLRSTWPLYGRSPEPRIRGLRTWLWARIERSFGDPIQAEVYLSRAVSLFRELGAAHDHAVSGLDLADVYLRLGEFEEARRVLLESRDFLEQYLHSEGFERWLSLASAASLTPALLAQATAYFRRFWFVPSEPAA
jgi:tetratricopeptide (TPR) repeat protein